MERLTWEYKDGGMFVDGKEVKNFIYDDESVCTGNAIIRLAKYEDAEEQGLLHKAPVPDGTSIFRFSYVDLFDETMEVSKDSYLHGYTEAIIGEMNKDWFLTEEAANEALKGSEGE